VSFSDPAGYFLTTGVQMLGAALLGTRSLRPPGLSCRFDVPEAASESIPESDAFYTLLGRTSPDLGRLPPDGRKWPFQYQQSNKDVIFTANAQAVEITKFAAFVNTLVSVPITPEQSARHARRSRPASARGFFAHAAPLEISSRVRSAHKRKRSDALPVQMFRSTMIVRTQLATGSASMMLSIAALRFSA
jgi:hypothetical protein